MINILLNTQLVQQQDTTDTQQILLLDTVLPIATIKLVGDATIPFRVLVEVGIEQVKLNSTNVYLPYASINNQIIVVRHFEHHVGTISILHLLDRELVEVLSLVVSLLAAIGRKGLCEITVAIEEAYSAEIDIRIRCLLNVVTSQNTETAGIDLQASGQTVLHAEISNRRTLCVLGFCHIRLETGDNIVHLSHQFLVGNNGIQFVEIHGLEHSHWIMSGRTPQFDVEFTPEFASIGIPRPPKVACYRKQILKLCRQVGLNGNSTPSRGVGVTNLYFHNS